MLNRKDIKTIIDELIHDLWTAAKYCMRLREDLRQVNGGNEVDLRQLNYWNEVALERSKQIQFWLEKAKEAENGEIEA